MTIEVVVYNVASAMAAERGGADRIELCDNPGEGGTTPSAGVVEVVRQQVTLDVYAMLRPRGGDFLYSSYEFHAMKRDLSVFQKLSVDGVVLGILMPDGTLDKKRCAELIARARPLKVTCHRAFDMTRDPVEALEDCIEVGFDRILTSGRAPKAWDGVPVIRSLIQQASGRISVMAGAGINEDNVSEIVSATGAREIHFSAAVLTASQMNYQNPLITGMGSGDGHEYHVRTVSPEVVNRMKALAHAAVSIPPALP